MVDRAGLTLNWVQILHLLSQKNGFPGIVLKGSNPSGPPPHGLATVLEGLKSVGRFSSPLARFTSITEACGESVIVGNTEVVLSVFPNARNRGFSGRILSAFDRIPQGRP